MGLFSKSEADRTAGNAKAAASQAKSFARSAERHAKAGRTDAAAKAAANAEGWKNEANAHYQHGEKRGWW